MTDGGHSSMGSVAGVSREVGSSAPVPVLVATAERVLDGNGNAVEFFGATDREDLVGASPESLVHAGDRDRVGSLIQRTVRDGETPPPVRARFVDGDGRVRETVATVAPVTRDGDQAARVVLADAPRPTGQSPVDRGFGRRILDAIDAAVFVFDEQGTLAFVNEAALERTGYDRSTLRAGGLERLFPEAQHDRVPEIWAGDGDNRVDLDLVTADDERIPHEVVGSRVAEPGGEDFLIAVARDVTERRQRERKLRRQNERLEEFASVVSHDLRNPLEVARSNLALVEGDDAAVDRIDRALDRMNHLIEEVLTLAQEGQVVDETDAVSVASVAAACWETAATQDAEFVVDQDCWIRADEGRLASLLENLYRNSVEHGGKDVTVRVGPLPGDEDGFYVEDDGQGIPVPERENIFEPGFSTDDDGTGFGLVIVDQIARAHGWSVRVTRADPALTGVDEDPDATPGTRFEFSGVETIER